MKFVKLHLEVEEVTDINVRPWLIGQLPRSQSFNASSGNAFLGAIYFLSTVNLLIVNTTFPTCVCLYVLIYPKTSQTVIHLVAHPNIMSLIPLPMFIDLPLKPTDPPNSAWGLWSKNGFDDQLGSLNYLTDDLVLRIMRDEIRTGKRMGLK